MPLGRMSLKVRGFMLLGGYGHSEKEKLTQKHRI
jgi:hypothetical protein